MCGWAASKPEVSPKWAVGTNQLPATLAIVALWGRHANLNQTTKLELVYSPTAPTQLTFLRPPIPPRVSLTKNPTPAISGTTSSMPRKHTTKCCTCDPTLHQFFCSLKHRGCAHHGGTVSQKIEIPVVPSRAKPGPGEAEAEPDDDPIAEAHNSYRCLFACKKHDPAEHCSNRRCCERTNAEDTRRAFAEHIPGCMDCRLQYEAPGVLVDWNKQADEEEDPWGSTDVWSCGRLTCPDAPPASPI